MPESVSKAETLKVGEREALKPEILLSSLDTTDFRMLRRFYMAGPKPYDTSPYVQVSMRNELVKEGVSLTTRSIGLRLKRMVGLGLIEESGTTPKIYYPKEELRDFVKKLIGAYSASIGLEHF